MNHPASLSYWERESFFKGIDIVVIGGGIVGLNAAIRLKEIDPSVSVAVFERGALPEGASTRNAGFACFGSITELLDDLKNTSEAEVFALIERRYRGLLRLRDRVGDAAMDYEAHGGFEIFKNTEGSVLEACLDSLSYFNQQLKPIIGRDNIYQKSNTNFGFAHTQATLIHNTAEGQIHVGKMMQALISLAKKHNILIFNGLKINKILDNTDSTSSKNMGVTLTTEEGWDITTQKVIVATNGFARRLMPELEVTPARNQVLITHPIDNLKIKGCFHYDKGYYYFRNVGNRLLLGGGRNLDFEGEQTDDFDATQVIQSALKNLLSEVILPDKKIEIDAWWSGILGIGTVKKPIIKAISRNVVVAVRMGGMGVAIGSLVGEEAAHLLLNPRDAP